MTGNGNAVFGNSAYDFRNTDTYQPEEYSAGKNQSAAKPARKAGRRKHRGISAFAMAGAVLTAAALSGSLMAQARLVAVSNETVAELERVDELRDLQARLQIEYAQAFDLAELERYAREELGMRAPSADQIIYTDSSREGE